jgi:hypothetical protein
MSSVPATASARSGPTHVPEPPIARFLFADTCMAWFWLLVRLYGAWQWLDAGWEKVQNPAWFGGSAAGALRGLVRAQCRRLVATIQTCPCLGPATPAGFAG